MDPVECPVITRQCGAEPWTEVIFADDSEGKAQVLFDSILCCSPHHQGPQPTARLQLSSRAALQPCPRHIAIMGAVLCDTEYVM